MVLIPISPDINEMKPGRQAAPCTLNRGGRQKKTSRWRGTNSSRDERVNVLLAMGQWESVGTWFEVDSWSAGRCTQVIIG